MQQWKETMKVLGLTFSFHLGDDPDDDFRDVSRLLLKSRRQTADCITSSKGTGLTEEFRSGSRPPGQAQICDTISFFFQPRDYTAPRNHPDRLSRVTVGNMNLEWLLPEDPMRKIAECITGISILEELGGRVNVSHIDGHKEHDRTLAAFSYKRSAPAKTATSLSVEESLPDPVAFTRDTRGAQDLLCS